MRSLTRRAVWMLGVSQCVYWGVLYYGFSVFLVPVQAELGMSRTEIAGAFSLSLLVGALMAPLVGRWIDYGRVATLMRVGVWFAVAGLLISSWATTWLGLYIAWTVIGVAMAMILYEPAFGLVIRAVHDSDDRLRSLAAVTIFGGLASTIFLPILGVVVPAFGWRNTQVFGVAVLLTAAWGLERVTFPILKPHARAESQPVSTAQSLPGGFFALSSIFVIGTLAGMGLTTLLIPLLIERGHAASVAAVVLAMLGVMQLPGRIWMLRGGHGSSLHALVTLPLVLQGAGLGVVTIASGAWLAAVGVAIFGVGAGLQTLARPWLVQALYGTAHAGHWNGRIARWQGVARAVGPVSAAALSATGSISVVFGGLSLALFAAIPLGLSLMKTHRAATTSTSLRDAA